MAREIILNCAASLDGRIAQPGGAQTQLSNLADLARVQTLRAGCDAVVVGSGTILADDPHLTVKPELAVRWLRLLAEEPELAEWTWRLREGWARILEGREELERVLALARRLKGQRADGLGSAELEEARELWELNPLRVILDGQGRTPRRANVVDARARTLIFTSQLGSVQLWGRFNGWPNVEVVLMDKAHEEKGVDLTGVDKGLDSQGVKRALVEGGSRIIGSFLTEGLARSLTVFYRPLLLGSSGVPLAEVGEMTEMGAASQVILTLEALRRLPMLEGDDWEGYLVRYGIGV